MLDKTTFTTNLKQLLNDCKTGEKSSEDFADGLVGLIEDFIKSATVTVDEGIPVSTTGSAAAQTGKTTSAGTGTIS